jgi:hypothetical protein
MVKFLQSAAHATAETDNTTAKTNANSIFFFTQIPPLLNCKSGYLNGTFILT